MSEIKFLCKSKDCVTQKTRDLLSKIADSVDLDLIYITSTQRTPLQQAEAVYENCLHKKYIAYKLPGATVQKRCIEGISMKEKRSDTIQSMIDVIEDFEKKGQRVSKHCVSDETYAKCNIVDISYSKMNREKAIEFIKVVKKEKSISKIIQPLVKDISIYDVGEPAIHLEIDQ